MVGKSKANKNRRSGQAIVEGTVALVLIVAIAVGAILLIIGSGLAVSYKSKIGFAAETGARYGAKGKSWLGATRPNYSNSQLQAEVTNAVNATLVGMGLPRVASEKITVAQTTIDGIQGLQVTVQADGLKIISGGLLPSAISMSESAFYAYDNDRPLGVLGLTVGATGPAAGAPQGLGQGLYIPVYGAGANAGGQNMSSYPTGSFPYWAASITRECNGSTISLMANNGNPYDSGQHNGTMPGSSGARQ